MNPLNALTNKVETTAGVAKHPAALVDLVEKSTTIVATAVQDVGGEIRAGQVLSRGKSGAITTEATDVLKTTGHESVQIAANSSNSSAGNFDASVSRLNAYKLGNNEEKNMEEGWTTVACKKTVATELLFTIRACIKMHINFRNYSQLLKKYFN